MSIIMEPTSNFDPAQAALVALSRTADDARRTNIYVVVHGGGRKRQSAE